MITLAADTITEVLQPEKHSRIVNVRTDSTTITRVSKSEEGLVGSNGLLVVVYESVDILLPPDTSLYAVSTGTPSISIMEKQEGLCI